MKQQMRWYVTNVSLMIIYKRVLRSLMRGLLIHIKCYIKTNKKNSHSEYVSIL